jgi:hypothetical protein
MEGRGGEVPGKELQAREEVWEWVVLAISRARAGAVS